MIVSPTRSAPVALDVKPTAQVERALAGLRRAGEADAGRVVAAAIIDVAGGAGRGRVVARLDGEGRVRERGGGRVDDAGDGERAGLAGGEAHEAPESVTVSVVPDAAPVAEQLE